MTNQRFACPVDTGTLSAEIGVPVTTDTFYNFAHTTVRRRLYRVRPRSVAHVRAAVRAARKYSLRLRATGSLTSSADLFPDEQQVLLDMSLFGFGVNDTRIYLDHPVSGLCSALNRHTPTDMHDTRIYLDHPASGLCRSGEWSL